MNENKLTNKIKTGAWIHGTAVRGGEGSWMKEGEGMQTTVVMAGGGKMGEDGDICNSVINKYKV